MKPVPSTTDYGEDADHGIHGIRRIRGQSPGMVFAGWPAS
jgi:hypothetical protein